MHRARSLSWLPRLASGQRSYACVGAQLAGVDRIDESIPSVPFFARHLLVLASGPCDSQLLSPSQPLSGLQFGTAVGTCAIDGDVLMVSGEPTFTLDRVRVFTRGPSGWTQPKPRSIR